MLFIKGQKANLPVQLFVQSNLTLLLAFLKVTDDGVEILEREPLARLECRPVVVRQPHGQIIVHSLKIELVTDDDVLLVGFVGVEVFEALFCSRL